MPAIAEVVLLAEKSPSGPAATGRSSRSRSPHRASMREAADDARERIEAAARTLAEARPMRNQLSRADALAGANARGKLTIRRLPKSPQQRCGYRPPGATPIAGCDCWKLPRDRSRISRSAGLRRLPRLAAIAGRPATVNRPGVSHRLGDRRRAPLLAGAGGFLCTHLSVILMGAG